MSITLAIFSPNKDSYSETFIQAHKNLPFNVKYYYGGHLPHFCEQDPQMLRLSLAERVRKKILLGFNYQEKKLLFSLRKLKVDAVLAEYGPTGVECLRVIQYLRLPMIVHFHGFDASAHSTLQQYGDRYRDVFEYAAEIIAVSNQMKNVLVSLGCPEQKIHVTCCAPADAFLQLKPNYSCRQFIAVGRFAPKKAPYLTLFAFKKVLDKIKDVSLTMIGDGELLPVCKQLVKHLEIENKVNFLGACTPEIIRNELVNSIAFLQHSVVAPSGDSEGTPVAVLEAMAARLPVVSTLHAGISDVVIHGETGYLVEEHDVDSMAHYMIKIASDISLAIGFGLAGRQRVKENFTMKKHLGLLTELIENALLKD